LTTPQGILEAWAERFEKDLHAKSRPLKGQEASMIVLSPKTWRKVLTPGRLKLLGLLDKQSVESISELAERAGKPLEVVSRDLKILRNFELIDLERRGKRKKPVLRARTILLQLSKD